MGRVSSVEGEIPPESLPAGVTAELVVHDGHAPGHTAVWLAESRVLVAGDMLSEQEVPLPFDPDDLPSYLTGLDLLAPYVARAAVLIPGHGSPTSDPMSRLDADRRYLDAVMRGRIPDDPRLAGSRDAWLSRPARGPGTSRWPGARVSAVRLGEVLSRSQPAT